MRTRHASSQLSLLWLVLLAGCPAHSPAPSPDGGADSGADGSAACQSSMECESGQLCLGPPGCGARWSCVPAPGCTRDLVPFCGCDGMTFRASSTCPERPYKHTGACATACEAQDARGVGACDAILGVFWDGATCRFVSGCSCEGKACMSGYRGMEECLRAYLPCIKGPRPERAPCSKGEECETGVCEGEGCGPDEARCVSRARICTRDLVAYCGCDGMTFRASSTCPSRPYKHKGECR